MSARGSSTDSDADRHATAYGYATINATVMNATMNANMAHANAANTNASSCGSVS